MIKLVRWIAILMALMMTSQSAVAVEIFQQGSGPFSMGLSDGETILLPPEYWIDETAHSFVFSAGIDGPWGFFDKETGCLHPAEFDDVGDCFSTDPDSPVLVKKDGYYGYVNRHNLETAIPFKYQSLHHYSEFENGYAIIGKGQDTLAGGSEYVLIDRNGTEILFPSGYEPYSLPDEGLVFLIDPATRLFGKGNLDGEVLIPPVYEGFGPLCEGYRSYCKDGLWGHMDASGNIIVPPTFLLCYDEEDPESPWGYYFENGVATLRLASEDGGWQEIQIDYEGNRISEMHTSDEE